MSDITWFGHSAFKISNQDVHVVIDPFLAPQYGFSVDDVGRADLVLLTHDHADQTHGIDDIRAFFIRQAGKIDCHMDEATAATVQPFLDHIPDVRGHVFPNSSHMPHVEEFDDCMALVGGFLADCDARRDGP